MLNPCDVHIVSPHLKSLFQPKPIKVTKTKWKTTLGKKKGWEYRALAKIKADSAP